MILLQSGSYYVLRTRGGLEWAMTTKAGPNDARHVVWALGMIFLRFFWILTNDFIIYRFVLCFMDVRRLVSASLDQNLQQRPNTAHKPPAIPGNHQRRTITTNNSRLQPTTAQKWWRRGRAGLRKRAGQQGLTMLQVHLCFFSFLNLLTNYPLTCQPPVYNQDRPFTTKTARLQPRPPVSSHYHSWPTASVWRFSSMNWK